MSLLQVRSRQTPLAVVMLHSSVNPYLLEINASPRQAIDSIMPVAKDYLPGPREQICLCEEQDGPHIHRVCEIDKKVKTIAVGGAIQIEVVRGLFSNLSRQVKKITLYMSTPESYLFAV